MKIDTFFATFSRKPKKFPHDECAPPRKGALRPGRGRPEHRPPPRTPGAGRRLRRGRPPATPRHPGRPAGRPALKIYREKRRFYLAVSKFLYTFAPLLKRNAVVAQW